MSRYPHECLSLVPCYVQSTSVTYMLNDTPPLEMGHYDECEHPHGAFLQQVVIPSQECVRYQRFQFHVMTLFYMHGS